MFEFLKSKSPKEQAEYNKQKIIDKNVKEIIKTYDKIIKNMINNGISYENNTIMGMSISGYSYFSEESTNQALIQLQNKYKSYNIKFNVTWTGCENSYIGISIEFI